MIVPDIEIKISWIKSASFFKYIENVIEIHMTIFTAL